MPNLTRRAVIAGAALAATAAAPGPTVAWDYSFPSIDGGTLALASFRGRVLLVVNTASFCGYTYQYEALEKLHRDLTPRGLTVVGIPSQDFNQEKGSNGEVKQFCELTYGVQFPMAGITHVRGPDADPFYKWVARRDGWQPDWNFNKVLISRDGGVVEHFGSPDEPTGEPLLGSIMRQLSVGA